LQVFNALGQQITTFVNTKQAAGTYTQNIQALPPGTYWLRLTVDDKLETKQLMVVQ